MVIFWLGPEIPSEWLTLNENGITDINDFTRVIHQANEKDAGP
jgi:hypothetical protein